MKGGERGITTTKGIQGKVPVPLASGPTPPTPYPTHVLVPAIDLPPQSPDHVLKGLLRGLKGKEDDRSEGGRGAIGDKSEGEGPFGHQSVDREGSGDLKQGCHDGYDGHSGTIKGPCRDHTGTHACTRPDAWRASRMPNGDWPIHGMH